MNLPATFSKDDQVSFRVGLPRGPARCASSSGLGADAASWSGATVMELLRRRMLLARVLTGAEGSGPVTSSPVAKGETRAAATCFPTSSSSSRMPDCASSEMRLATMGCACVEEKTASLGSLGFLVGRRAGAGSSLADTPVFFLNRPLHVPPESAGVTT